MQKLALEIPSYPIFIPRKRSKTREDCFVYEKDPLFDLWVLVYMSLGNAGARCPVFCLFPKGKSRKKVGGVGGEWWGIVGVGWRGGGYVEGRTKGLGLVSGMASEDGEVEGRREGVGKGRREKREVQ